MTELAEAYKNSPDAQYVRSVIPALKQMRIFEVQGAINVAKQSHHLHIPEVDQRLIDRYQVLGNDNLEKEALAKNKPVRIYSSGQTKVDQYANGARAFSDWLHKQGLPTIASRLHDSTLMGDLKRFGETAAFDKARAALRVMRAIFPPESPGVTFGRIGHVRFVNALGALGAMPTMSVGDAANKVGADVDDLLVFLDARSVDGLTEAGRVLVNTFDGQALQAARASIAMRRAMMAAQPNTNFGQLGSIVSDVHEGGYGFDLNTPSEVAQPAADSLYAGLSSINSGHRQGRFGFDLNTPSEVAQPAADSFYAGLSSINSGHRQGRFGFDLNTPSEVAQPAAADSFYDDLSSINSGHRQGHFGFDPNTPSEVAGPSGPAREIVDVDDYPSPQAQFVPAAQRLAGGAWLGDEDLLRYSQMFLQAFAEELGPNGHERINQMLHIADPQQVQLLVNGEAHQRAAVLNHLTAPILLLPVNDPNHHWSLLVVYRSARQAYHYDSMVPPQLAESAGHFDQFHNQFAIARQVANVFGIQEPRGMPTAMQPDGHSCGDHVLAGIEALARGIVNRQADFTWDLSAIQPSRQRIVDTLTRYEQFHAETNAAQAPQPSRYREARPRKKRG